MFVISNPQVSTSNLVRFNNSGNSVIDHLSKHLVRENKPDFFSIK